MSRSIAALHVCLHLLNVGRDGLSLRQVKWNDYAMLVAGFHDGKCSFCDDIFQNNYDYLIEQGGEKSLKLDGMYSIPGLGKLFL